MQITLLAGRDAAKERAFYARVVELLKEKPGVRPEDVVINLMEDKPEDWSFGNGVGQYMVLPRRSGNRAGEVAPGVSDVNAVAIRASVLFPQ